MKLPLPQFLCRATSVEREASLPGDWLIPHPTLASTRAISIGIAPPAVWPWIAQIGQDRGGFYSYSWLENALGCQIRNASRIHPEWQHLEQGDVVKIHPRTPPLVVKSIEPGSYLVLFQPAPLRWSWCFTLTEVMDRNGVTASRLVVRSRCSVRSAMARPAVWALMGCGHAVMEQRMLTGIGRRAERTRSSFDEET